MRKEKRILNNLKMISYLFIAIAVCSSCKQRTFEKEIKTWGTYQQQIPLPILMHAEDTPIIFVCISCAALVDEISKCNKIDEECAGAVLYDAYIQKLPIRVSSSFYQEHLDAVITVVPALDSIYRRQGIQGIINHCFRQEEGWLVLDKTPMLPYKPGRWSNTEMDYIIYLLSLHDMYIAYHWVDDVFYIVAALADRISDMP